MNNKLLDGSIYKAIFTLAIPLVLANLLQTVYNLTDTFWVGRLGANAVAAVSLSFPIIFLLLSLGSGFTAAGAIYVSQYKGDNNPKKINKITAQTLLVTGILSILITIVGYFASSILIGFMGTEPAVFFDAVKYLKISFLGTIFFFGYMVFQSVMRGVGEVKIPMYIVLSTVLLNFILDPLFILGYKFIPAYGVSGAAIATLLTQSLSTVIGLTILFKRNKYEILIRISDFKPKFKMIKDLFKLGFPTTIEQSLRSISMFLMIIVVSSFGTIALASYGIGMRIFSFVLIPALGFAMANSTLVGQSMGARKIKRAVEISKKNIFLSFSILTILGVFIFIFSKQIVAAFIPNEIEVINMGGYLVKLMALSFGFLAINIVVNGTFRGSGNAVLAMVLTLFWAFSIVPLSYFLSKTSLGVSGIWWSYPIINFAGAMIVLFFFKRGKWKNKRLIKPTFKIPS